MKFALPPAGALVPNNPHDPLPYYYRPLTGWLYRKRLQMGLDLVPARGEKVLEVGVGSGILVPTLSSRFATYVGVDLMLAAGLSRLVASGCRAEFVTGDILEAPTLPADTFDVVVCLSVLEHIADADAAAAALARALAKGGTLVAGYPMVNRVMTRFFRLLGFGDIDEHHVTKPRAIDKALRRVLLPGRRKALPFFAPVPLALYQCTAWTKA